MTNDDAILRESVERILAQLGVRIPTADVPQITSRSPISGHALAEVSISSEAQLAESLEAARKAFEEWQLVPPPARGELVRLFGVELRAHKRELGELITIETGKILSEGLGEVQEMIDMCDFAVGLSRQLYGLTIATERPGHRMMETWHPLGVVGVISAFNFPAAVWAWNAALALVCGNSIVWKPSEKTPITALACQALFDRAAARFEKAPENLSTVVIGEKELGEALVDSPRIDLLSATGSTEMGRAVGPRLAQRFARSILELGGNNAGIVCESADLSLALPAVTFGATGTAGQRCTSTRRLFVHDRVYDEFASRLISAYKSLRIGNPLSEKTLVGPLIDFKAFASMEAALDRARNIGGTIHGGERIDIETLPDGYYVAPAIVEMPEQVGPVLEETFAPILYVMRFTDLEDAIRKHNEVGAGLSSTIFTLNLREAERFLASNGSDCGIVNVNIGTSGAEIGGAFGGEKETGGGREAGSDAWKSYMRRATNTINFSSELPLAQGVSFDLAES